MISAGKGNMDFSVSKDEIVFPVLIELSDNTKSSVIDLNFSYGMCQKICRRVDVNLSLAVPLEGISNMALETLIEDYRSRVPAKSSFRGMSVERATMTTADKPTLEVIARASEPFVDPKIIFEGTKGITFGKSSIRLLAGGRRAIIISSVDGDKEELRDLINKNIVVTLIDQKRSIERLMIIDNAD